MVMCVLMDQVGQRLSKAQSRLKKDRKVQFALLIRPFDSWSLADVKGRLMLSLSQNSLKLILSCSQSH